MNYPEIASRLFNVPLAVHPDKLLAVLSAVGPRLAGAEPDEWVIEGLGESTQVPAASTRLGDRLGRTIQRANEAQGQDRFPFDMVHGVAVLGVHGTLVQRGFHVGMSSGRTSYQGIQAQLMRAAVDPRVQGVVLEVDSSGGEVAGMIETANMVAELSNMKPTMAIMADAGLSAAYAIASAARQVVVPETGLAGSIGAVMVHLDRSAALAKQGVKVTVIASGKHKAEGNSAEALSDHARARAQQHVDLARDAFATAVGRYRAGRLSKAGALATEADVFTGREAVRRGLADATGNPNEAFAAFLSAVSRRTY